MDISSSVGIDDFDEDGLGNLSVEDREAPTVPVLTNNTATTTGKSTTSSTSMSTTTSTTTTTSTSTTTITTSTTTYCDDV